MDIAKTLGLGGEDEKKDEEAEEAITFPLEGGGTTTIKRTGQSDKEWTALKNAAVKQAFKSEPELKNKAPTDEAVAPDKQAEVVFVDPVGGGKPVKVPRKGLSSAEWSKWATKSAAQNKVREEELRFLHKFINDPSELDEVDVGPVDDAVTGKFKVNPNDKTYSQRGGRIVRSKANAVQRAAELEREFKERGLPLPDLEKAEPRAAVPEEEEAQQLAGRTKGGEKAGGGMASGGGFLQGVRRQVEGSVAGASPAAFPPKLSDTEAALVGAVDTAGDVARIAGGAVLAPMDPTGAVSGGLIKEGARGIGWDPLTGVAGVGPQLKQQVQQGAAAVGDVLFPRSRAEARARDTAAAAPPAALAAAQPAPAPAAAPPGGSADVSVKARGPGGGPASGEADPVAMALEARRVGAAGIEAEKQNALQRAAAESELRQQSDSLMLQEQNYMKWRQEQVGAEVEAFRARAKAIDDEIRKVNTSVDPNRIWKEQSTFGKVLTGIGLAMGGDISIIQKAVEQDIQAQKDSIAGKMGQLNTLRANALNLYQEVQKAGMDAYEAHKVATALAYGHVMDQIKGLAAKYPNAEAGAMQAHAKLGLEVSKNLEQAENHRGMRALQWFEARAKQGAAGGKAVTLKDQARENLGKLKSALELTDQLSKSFGTGVASALKDKLTSWVPGTHGAQYNIQRDQFLRSLGLLIDQSTLTKSDVEHWEQLVPGAGDLQGQAKIAAIKQAIKSRYEQILISHEQGGANVSGYRAGAAPSDIMPIPAGAEPE